MKLTQEWEGRRTMRTASRLVAAAALVGLAGLAGPGGLALAEEGLESRLKALERRVDRLERELKEKDAVIERLRDRLERKGAAPRLPGLPEPPGEPRERPFGGRPDQFDDLHERMRKEIERWGLEWGIPGRERRPEVRPRELRPFVPSRRVLLGIEMEDAQGEGVAIRRVLPGSPAAEAGIAAGDELLAIDGHPVVTPTEVIAIVGAHQPGDELQLAIRRAGKRVTVRVKLAPRESEGPLPMPRWRFGPSKPWQRGGRDRRERGGRDGGEAKAGDSIKVETPITGGRASVSFSAPGLHLSEALAREVDLTEAERGEVEAAFARARDGLARSLAEELSRGEGKLETGAVTKKRLEAEKEAREILAGKLPEEKLRALERAQAKLGARSGVSISISRGHEQRRREAPDPRGTRPRGEPEMMPFEESQEF